MSRIAVFGYGSLVSRASVAATLGRDAPRPTPARLAGWRRRWSIYRDNARVEKRFAAVEGEPFEFCLGLNLERAPDAVDAEWPNGALIEVTAAELDRLDLRELRYDRTDVTGEAGAAQEHDFDAVFAYVAKPGHYAPEPPPGSVVIAAYVRACREAFAELGDDAWAEFERTTGPVPAPVVEARLVLDRIPPGNPTAW